MASTSTVFIACLAASLLCGCVSVPMNDQLIAHGDTGIVSDQDAGCDERWQAPSTGPAPGPALDPAGFGVMTWNVYKARRKDWPAEFARFSEGHDLVLLQEAHLTSSFRAVLERSGLGWSMARAYDYKGVETGVLTVANARLSGACVHRAMEPVLRTPKSALVTRYPLEGAQKELWVANLHGINFTLGTATFREQLESLAEVLHAHTGPLVLAGDFNSWSDRRIDILRQVAARLRLKPVTLADDRRTRFMDYPLDHVFYRGLEVISADSVGVSSSDHNPIRVRFRVPENYWKGHSCCAKYSQSL